MRSNQLSYTSEKIDNTKKRQAIRAPLFPVRVFSADEANGIKTEPRHGDMKAGIAHHPKQDAGAALWWRQGDSNSRPHGCEPCALTN